MNQIEIHKKIDEFFKVGVEVAGIDVARELKDKNFDSKNYFFFRADEFWLTWLWENGFLDKIKEKAGDFNSYTYQISELDYLVRVTKKVPAQVAEIILSVPISEENLNPEVVDRFFWIISEMPIDQIKILINKIKNEKWVYLMRKFNRLDYGFDKIVKKLIEAKEYEALLEVVKIILEVQSKEDFNEKKKNFSFDNPFYLDYISRIGIFEILANIDDLHSEEVLKITTEILGNIVKLREREKYEIFKYEDPFLLYDKDIFEVDFKRRSISPREDAENLVVTIKKLVEKIISENCVNEIKVKKILKIIYDIPENFLVWRLRLFTLAQCPKVFKDEIKQAFFRIFEVGERYFDIEGGAEYDQLLVRCFSLIDEPIQREYVNKIFEYFGAELEDKDKEGWRKRDGGKILCLINTSLTKEEKEKAKKIFGVFPGEVECIPEPIVSHVSSGMVTYKTPEDIGDLTINEIVQKLKTDLMPEKLKETYKNDDFLNPRGAEGLGNALKDDIKKRLTEYLDNICMFFDRKNIAPNYVYSLLRGIEEMFRDKKSFNEKQIGQIFDFFELIRQSGLKDSFRSEKNESWLADWITVHKAICDVMLQISENSETGKKIHLKFRKKIKEMIEYLLGIKDSPLNETDRFKDSDPYVVAINSVRGRAYQIFTMFAQNDGKELANDVKEIFKKTLKDNSLAVRFVIGHYLATFYFRDKDFIVKLLPEIFPKDDPNKKDIYLATWEGYLTNTLYSELFNELQEYYEYAIELNPEDYPKRKYFKNLDEALAIHLALVFAHLELNFEDLLFKHFWEKENQVRYFEFVSFIGRSCLTRDDASEEWLKKNNVDKKKLIDFWDWILKNKNITGLKVFSGFGLWINPDKKILDDNIVIKKLAETLIKSNGDIDWEYGFTRRLPIFARTNGKATLDAIRYYLLDSDGELNKNRQAPLLHDGEIKDSLDIIYKNGNNELRQEVEKLINILIEKGSSIFWGLKDILK